MRRLAIAAVVVALASLLYAGTRQPAPETRSYCEQWQRERVAVEPNTVWVETCVSWIRR